MLKEDFQTSIVIAKPLEEVFLFVSDVANFPLWTGASLINAEVETPDKIGDSYTVTFSSLFSKSSSTIQITEYQQPFLWAFHAQVPKGTFSYKFETLEEGTKVTLTYVADEATSILIDLSTKGNMGKLLYNLKKYLETVRV